MGLFEQFLMVQYRLSTVLDRACPFLKYRLFADFFTPEEFQHTFRPVFLLKLAYDEQQVHLDALDSADGLGAVLTAVFPNLERAYKVLAKHLPAALLFLDEKENAEPERFGAFVEKITSKMRVQPKDVLRRTWLTLFELTDVLGAAAEDISPNSLDWSNLVEVAKRYVLLATKCSQAHDRVQIKVHNELLIRRTRAPPTPEFRGLRLSTLFSRQLQKAGTLRMVVRRGTKEEVVRLSVLGDLVVLSQVQTKHDVLVVPPMQAKDVSLILEPNNLKERCDFGFRLKNDSYRFTAETPRERDDWVALLIGLTGSRPGPNPSPAAAAEIQALRTRVLNWVIDGDTIRKQRPPAPPPAEDLEDTAPPLPPRPQCPGASPMCPTAAQPSVTEREQQERERAKKRNLVHLKNDAVRRMQANGRWCADALELLDSENFAAKSWRFKRYAFRQLEDNLDAEMGGRDTPESAAGCESHSTQSRGLEVDDEQRQEQKRRHKEAHVRLEERRQRKEELDIRLAMALSLSMAEPYAPAPRSSSGSEAHSDQASEQQSALDQSCHSMYACLDANEYYYPASPRSLGMAPSSIPRRLAHNPPSDAHKGGLMVHGSLCALQGDMPEFLLTTSF